jgi:hypothetical protein
MRTLTDQHKERIREGMLGNKNAVKDGRFSVVPHTLVCSNCLRLMFCPHYKAGSACVFLWEKVSRIMQRSLQRPSSNVRLMDQNSLSEGSEPNNI